MPKILEDTAIDAQTRVVTCSMCDGEGKVGSDSAVNRQRIGVCSTCHGDGKVRLLGDKDSRQLMFETAGLRKGGAVQAVQVNVGNSVPQLEDMITEVEDALDVEVIEEEENGNVRGSEPEGPKQIGEGSPEDEEDPGGGPGTVH